MMMLFHKQDLYNFEIKHPKFEKVLKGLMRNYGGLFEEHVHINEFVLAKRLLISVPELEDQLRRLTKLEVLEYIPKSQLPKLIFTANKVVTRLEISPENYKLLKKTAEERAASCYQSQLKKVFQKSFTSNLFVDENKDRGLWKL